MIWGGGCAAEGLLSWGRQSRAFHAVGKHRGCWSVVQAVYIQMRSQLGHSHPLLHPPDKSLQMELCVAVE